MTRPPPPTPSPAIASAITALEALGTAAHQADPTRWGHTPGSLARAAEALVYRLVALPVALPRLDPSAALPAPRRWAALAHSLAVGGPLGALGVDASEPDCLALLATPLPEADCAAVASALDPVTFGDLPAVHEALLARLATIENGRLVLADPGSARRAAGSFYTPSAVVNWLLDTALEPALDEALASPDPRAALHSLRLCDPTCGAGAFLIPAAARIALRLAALGTPDPGAAVRCVRGVDLDPLALLLCRLGLWLAALTPSTPEEERRDLATHLCSAIRLGDTLLGADTPVAPLPDLAFAAHPGDDRGIALSWRALNRAERKHAAAPSPDAADAWCSAFFWPRTTEAPAPPTAAKLASPSLLAPATRYLVDTLTAARRFLHWGRAFPDVSKRGGFDVVLGNPPFLNQLEADTTTARPAAALLRARFGDILGAYTDTASLVLLQGARLLREGGRLGMIQPQSLLAAQDGQGVRRTLADFAPPTHVWWAGAHVFPGASVFVTALVLRRAPLSAALTRAVGLDFRALPDLPLDPTTLSAESWTPLVAEALGAPPVVLRGPGVLGDLARATADFRDEYYGLIPFVVDRAEADEASFPRLLLTGHIDPAWSKWGARPVRFGKRAWTHPRIDLDRLVAQGDLAAWVASRRAPKLFVATQTRVIEALAHPAGVWLTTTPTITVLPDPAAFWRVAAVLLSPPTSAWALARYGASALAAGALKLSARQVLGIPLPEDPSAWDEAASLIEAAHAGTDAAETRAHLLAAGKLLTRAYRADDDVYTWWVGRLPPLPALGPSADRTSDGT